MFIVHCRFPVQCDTSGRRFLCRSHCGVMAECGQQIATEVDGQLSFVNDNLSLGGHELTLGGMNCY